jgi:hypothetical protein
VAEALAWMHRPSFPAGFDTHDRANGGQGRSGIG